MRVLPCALIPISMKARRNKTTTKKGKKTNEVDWYPSARMSYSRSHTQRPANHINFNFLCVLSYAESTRMKDNPVQSWIVKPPTGPDSTHS